MKTSPFILLSALLTLAACNDPAPTSSWPQKTTEDEALAVTSLGFDELLSNLFGADSIVNGTLIWKPGQEDPFLELASADGFCHTILDTTFTIDDSHYVVYKTEKLDANGNKEICRPCIPNYSIGLLAKNGNSYTIKAFKKDFARNDLSGVPGEPRPEILAETGLIFMTSYLESVATVSQEKVYYSPITLEKVFAFEEYKTTDKMFDRNSPEYEQTERKLVSKGKGKFQLEITEVKFDTKQDKQISTKTIESYTIVDNGNKVVKE